MSIMYFFEQMSIGMINLISVFGLIVGTISLWITIRTYRNTKKIKIQLISKNIAKNNYKNLSIQKGNIDGMISAMGKDTEINYFDIQKVFATIVTILAECDFSLDKSLNKNHVIIADCYNDIKNKKYTKNEEIMEILIKSQKSLDTILEYLNMQ